MWDYADAINLARRMFSPDRSALEAIDPAAEFLVKAAGNVTSQNGEDGILAALFDRVKTLNRWCFEAGASDGLHLSNTWALRKAGWTALLVEADAHQYAELYRRFAGTAFLCPERIGPDSLDRILAGVRAPLDPDLGVIDVDGEDLKIWEGLKHFAPRVLLVEFNVGGDGRLGGVGTWQAGRDSVIALGREKGYRPLLRCGCNLLFVPETLAI